MTQPGSRAGATFPDITLQKEFDGAVSFWAAAKKAKGDIEHWNAKLHDTCFDIHMCAFLIDSLHKQLSAKLQLHLESKNWYIATTGIALSLFQLSWDVKSLRNVEEIWT